MYSILLYIVLFLILYFLLILVYVKITFKFWALQPVFHVYDIGYYIFPPGIIQNELPEKNKYCNMTDIETIKFSTISEIKQNQFVKFISTHYLQNKENRYSPKKINIFPYFDSHNADSFLSFYTEKELLVSLKKGTTSESSRIVGVMTSRPLHVTINNSEKATFDVYYVDHLCVDTMYRKKGIASQIIQTHHYNQRHHNRKIVVSLFKREDVLTGIIPLCVYTTYGFDMETWRKPIDLVSYISLVECSKTNIHILIEFLEEQTSWFDICIIPEVSNIVNLITTKNIFIYMIIIDNEVKCAYFFRKLCTFIRDKCEAIGCFASINNCDNDIFIHGYKVALWNICEKEGCSFAVVENISHNHILINNLKIKTRPSIESPTAYFFYNFAYHTFSSQRTLILH